VSWLRLSIDLEEPEIDLAEAQLEALGAVSVTVTAAGEEVIVEPDPGTVPVWRRCRLEALFDLSVDVAGLQKVLGEVGIAVADVGFLEDADWQSRWRRHAVNTRIGDRLWLVPKDVEPPDEPALKLDPGLAFGTGSHPTTRLCLNWLAGQSLAGMTVLDYGCGSGILGLAALKLGCDSVVAIDHDPQALLATEDNAAYNALADRRLVVGGPELLGDQRFDVVLANILANPLIELAPALTRALVPAGVIVMSGMLEDQWQTVSAAYPDIRFEPPAIEADEHLARWVCLTGRRTGKNE
jgi:ribosomal protein L11 methyltransferase